MDAQPKFDSKRRMSLKGPPLRVTPKEKPATAPQPTVVPTKTAPTIDYSRRESLAPKRSSPQIMPTKSTQSSLSRMT